MVIEMIVVKKAAFVLRLIDDFSGEAIQKKKFVFESNGIILKAVEKAEGLHVFLEPYGEKVELKIWGPDYHTEYAVIEKATLDPKNPVADVRLFGKPGKDYPYTCNWVNGKIENRKLEFPVKVCTKMKDTGLTLKEIRKVDGETHVVCNGFTKEVLLGKTFCLTGNKKTEVFIIAEKKGMNEYRITGEILEEYKAKTPIERVFCSITDEKGYYSIPVKDGAEVINMEVIIL